MNLISFIALAFIFIHPVNILANDKLFTLNGKPVPEVVAKVNGVPLKSAILQRELFGFHFQSKQLGREVKPSDEPEIAQELVKGMVARELVVQKAKDLGITITQEQIDLQLKAVEDQFPSNESFITALAFQHMTIDDLENKINRTLLEDELMRREIAPKVDITEKAIKAYYDKNKVRFMKPVLYRIRHIHTATLQSSGKADDLASQRKANRLRNLFDGEAEEKIKSVLKKLQAGENFASLAIRFSEDEASKKKGGLLGDLHPKNTIPEIGKTMLELKEGETSGILKSQFGFHIIKLDEIIPSVLIPFAETKTDIMNLLLKIETEMLFKKYLENLTKTAEIETFI